LIDLDHCSGELPLCGVLPLLIFVICRNLCYIPIRRQLQVEGVDAYESEISEFAIDALIRSVEAPELAASSYCPAEPTVWQFIGTAVASGILGNIAYDALMTVVHRVSSKATSVSPPEALEEIVLFAVAEQCRRYQLSVSPDKLRVRQWRQTPAGAVAMIDAKGSELTAEVTVPYNHWRTRGLNVRIRDVSQREEIARAAKSKYHADFWYRGFGDEYLKSADQWLRDQLAQAEKDDDLAY
jgi:hypothetical protein